MTDISLLIGRFKSALASKPVSLSSRLPDTRRYSVYCVFHYNAFVPTSLIGFSLCMEGGQART